MPLVARNQGHMTRKYKKQGQFYWEKLAEREEMQVQVSVMGGVAFSDISGPDFRQ